MKNKLLLSYLLFLIITTFSSVNAQTLDSTGGFGTANKISPNGIFDNVFDQYGNKYSLGDIVAGANYRGSGGVNQPSSLLCAPGYFNLYFEAGCGMDGNTAVEVARRAVICQVFADISDFIESPLETNGQNNRVNIWIRNINQIDANSANSGVLGLATAFYNVPQNNVAGFGGIADNEIWKTIHSGSDSYTNVASPIVTQGGVNTSGGTFYHGYAAFNFNNATINWNTNLGIASSPAGLYDLYSVALHEVTHALGFASLINFDGQSKLGAGFNYYSRYDLRLQNNAATESLIENTGACSLYDFTWNTNLDAITTLAPNAACNTNHTTCGSAVRYSYISGGTQAVYTTNCFEAPSSLSHFEDECQVPAPLVAPQNDLYFVMSNANGTGATFTKRHLTPEERHVLCDLGYTVNPIFGSAGNNNFFNYGVAQCAGINVAGINDGIDNVGSYSFTGNVGVTFPITGILNNDNNASEFECLMDVYDATTILSTTNGTNVTQIDFTSNNVGIHLLRYIPVSATGQRGNITYIYVYVLNANCTPSACNKINNGSAENTTNCGEIGSVGVTLDCWQQYICSPDILERGCAGSFGIPTIFNTPGADSWNGVGNDHFLRYLSMNGHYNESTQTLLNTPITQNGNYVVNFRARLANSFGGVPAGFNAQILFAGSPNLLASPGAIVTTALPPALTQLGNTVLIPNDNTWHQYSVPFTYLNATSLNNFIIMNSTNLNNIAGGFSTAIFIDDVTLTEASQVVSLTLPQTVCLNQTIPDLSSYLTPAAANGVFTGNGVQLVGGIYSFNAAIAGAGNHQITYTFTNGLGCEISVSDEITVNNNNINVIATASSTNVCVSALVVLTGAGANTYSWQPGNLLGSQLNVNPTTTTTYTLTGTNVNGCQGTASITINVMQQTNVSLLATPNQICFGESSTITLSGATTYTLQPGNLTSNGSAFVVSPTMTTTYTVTGTNDGECIGTSQITIGILNNCGIYCSDPVTQVIPDMATSATNPITAVTVDIMGTYTISSSITYSNIRFRMAPNSQIIVPAGVTLTLFGCKLFSCTEMWNGILIQGNGAELVSNNTWFEDAISAVNSINGGKYTITKSRFNKNYTGIYIDSYSPANASMVNSTIFECQTSLTSPGATLKAPYLNTVSRYGIDVLNNAGGLTFGLAGGGGLQNEFHHINIGIHSTKSKITVHNNYFHHLTRQCIQVPMDDPCQVEGWGILAETSGELYVGNMATTNPFNNTYSNTFVECDGGIMAQFHVRKIEICKNKFEKIGVLPVAEPNRKAIFINTNSNSEVQYCIIQNNKFKDNYRSILYQGNKYLLGRINSNKFNNSGEYGIKCMQNINGLATHVLDIKFNSMNDSTSLNSIYGIWVVNTVTTNSARLTIESNSIKKIQKAIWVTNMQNKAQVIKHNVNYSAISAAAGITFSTGTATSTSPNCGITVENCKGIHVKENDVTKQGANPNSTFSNTSYGITSSLSASSVISNNTLHKLGRGLILLGTPNASVVTCNYLDKNFYGLVLDNTNIVNQGSTTLAQDNQWSSASFTTAKTVVSTNSSIPIFYTRSSSTQFKPVPTFMLPTFPAPIDFQLTLPNPVYNCLFGCASPPCINPNLARIVKREPPFNLLPAEEQLIADFSTLQMIKENDSLTQFGQPEAIALIAFKDSLLNTNTGLLQTFVEKMDSGDSLLAKQALLAVVPSYSPEENAKIVDEVYYRTWAKELFELSREDSARLLQVAQQWPVKGGTAVFDARVMIGYWQNDHFVDNNNARLANNTSEDIESITDNYGVLYPNPAQNIINYDITLEEGETGFLMIYDVTGKLVNTQKIIDGESKSIIDCEKWNNGIYFYRLLINGETKASKSFMISK